MGVVEYAKNLAASIPQNNGFTMSPALLGAAGSVINGALGFFGQQSANKTNLKIARETNAANRANQEYQNEWNLEMWNKQNEYNSPAAMRQRLEAAGLNPIFNGLDGVSEAGQLQSADYVATPGAPMLNSGEFLGNGIANAAKTAAEIELMRSQAKKNDSERGLTDLELEIQNATKDTQIRVGNYAFTLAQDGHELNDAEIKLRAKNAEKVDAEISNINKATSMIDKDYNLREAAQKADQSYKEAMAEIGRKNLELSEKKMLQDFLLARQALVISMFEARTKRAETDLKYTQYNDYYREKFGIEVQILNGELYVTEVDGAKADEELINLIIKNGVESLGIYGDGILGTVTRGIDTIFVKSGNRKSDKLLDSGFSSSKSVPHSSSSSRTRTISPNY